MILGVGGVGKGVAHNVEGDGDDRQHHHREEELVTQRRTAHHLPPRLHQGTQGGSLQGDAQANIGQEHLVADGHRDGQGHTHGDDAHQIGQQVLHHDPPGRGAQTAGGQVVVPVADDNHLVADKPRRGQPGGQAHGEVENPFKERKYTNNNKNDLYKYNINGN